MSILSTLLALLVLPVGLYELITGEMPGGRKRWGMYRWISTPLRVRFASLVGLGVSSFLLLRYPPVTGGDFLGGLIGLCIGSSVVLGSRRANSRTIHTR